MPGEHVAQSTWQGDQAGGSADGPLVVEDLVLNDEVLPPTTVTRISLTSSDEQLLGEQIRAEHEAGERSLKEAVKHFRKCGEKLLQAKAALGYGHFARFLKSKAKLHPRMAQRYMMLAREMPKLPPADATRVSQLSLRDAICELARMSSRVAKLPSKSLCRALVAARGEPLKQSITRAINVERDAPLGDVPVVERLRLPVEPQLPVQQIQNLVDALRRTVRVYVECHPDMGAADICAAINEVYIFVQGGGPAISRGLGR